MDWQSLTGTQTPVRGLPAGSEQHHSCAEAMKSILAGSVAAAAAAVEAVVEVEAAAAAVADRVQCRLLRAGRRGLIVCDGAAVGASGMPFRCRRASSEIGHW